MGMLRRPTPRQMARATSRHRKVFEFLSQLQQSEVPDYPVGVHRRAGLQLRQLFEQRLDLIRDARADQRKS